MGVGLAGVLVTQLTQACGKEGHPQPNQRLVAPYTDHFSRNTVPMTDLSQVSRWPAIQPIVDHHHFLKRVG
jgi:hypothetical protein